METVGAGPTVYVRLFVAGRLPLNTLALAVTSLVPVDTQGQPSTWACPLPFVVLLKREGGVVLIANSTSALPIGKPTSVVRPAR
jgi:hypothetical protein